MAGEREIKPAAHTATAESTKERMSESNSFESILQPTGYFSISVSTRPMFPLGVSIASRVASVGAMSSTPMVPA